MVNFDEVKNLCHGRIRELLPLWLPGGSVSGNEYECGDIHGGAGKSLKVNLNTGMWADFAANIKGGDLISLYAAIKSIGQKEACNELSKLFGTKAVVKKNNLPARPQVVITKPPPDEPTPPMRHKTLGDPVHFWTYRDQDGSVLFHVARYQSPETGKKTFLPYSYTDKNTWYQRGWPAPRPLYGLETLKNLDIPIMICEGEKAADAARAICGKYYQVISWPNGSNAVDKTDWSPLFGASRVVIWPDADPAGRKAAAEIAQVLLRNSPKTIVKVINATHNIDGFDAADALEDGWTFKDFVNWAKDKAVVVQNVVVPEVISAQPKTDINVTISDSNDAAEVPQQLRDVYEKLGLVISSNGKAVVSVDNIVRIFEGHKPFQNLMMHDEFSGDDFIDFNAKTWKRQGTHEKIRDDHILALMTYIQRMFGLHRLSENMMWSAVKVWSRCNSFHGPKDWVSSLKWDQTPRVHDWLITYMGATDNEDYIRAAGKNFWVALIARIFQPGCKVDNMIVLEGPQGNKKSSSIMAIAGQWYLQMTEKVGSKDFYMGLRGKLLVEIAELDSFSKAEDSTIKAMMTGTKDTVRKSYGRVHEDYLRSCVFIGTTNDDEYLKDPTGARRYWPVKTTTIDLESLTRDRDQLFAEAVHLYNAGEKWYEMPESTTEVQEARRIHDSWEQMIGRYVVGKKEVTVDEVLCDGLKFDMADTGPREARRACNVLRNLGFENRVVKRFGRSARIWVKPEKKSTEKSATQMVLESLPNQAEKIQNDTENKVRLHESCNLDVTGENLPIF